MLRHLSELVASGSTFTLTLFLNSGYDYRERGLKNLDELGLIVEGVNGLELAVPWTSVSHITVHVSDDRRT